MIDICMAVYRNYDIARLTLEYMNRLRGDYRVLLVDNNDDYRDDVMFDILTLVNPRVVPIRFERAGGGWDGESHGRALDYLASIATAPIIATMDTDFFWTDPNIFLKVEDTFEKENVQAMGCAGWYPDWQSFLDPRHPDRAGHLAPVVWGQFLESSLAKSETFVSTIEESGKVMETGWRLRKKIIEDNLKCIVFPGFKYPKQLDREACFFGSPEEPIGIHFLKGTTRPTGDAYIYRNMVEVSMARWPQ